MTIEEYKDSILYHLEIAVDCEAVELIIYRSIEKMKEKHVHAHLISGYLNILKESLEQPSPNGFDSVHWCNIMCAISYLKKLVSH